MMISERQDKILALIQKRGRISIRELQELLLVSVSTMRRDLDKLADEGLVKRIHGGVELLSQHPTLQPEIAIADKTKLNQPSKQQIALTAIAQLQGGETLYLDAGTTTGAMIALLGQVTPAPLVVTNSVHHASQLADLMVPVGVIGGQVKLSTNATVGMTAAEQLGQLAFDVSFIGADAIDLTAGITTPDLEEAAIKRLVIAHSRHAFVLADASKFNQRAFAKVADLEEVTIITEPNSATELASYQTKTQLKIGDQS